MRIKPNFKSGADVTISKGGETAKVERWGVAHRAYPAIGGRIKTLPVEASNPSAGVVRPRSDSNTTLDLSAEERPGNVTFDIPGGRVGVVEVMPQQERDGWSNGDHYWLETDAQGRFVIEPGRRHRKFYISASSSAMTKAQVAADAGVSEATVTGEWMLTRPEYASEAQPITWDFADAINRDLYIYFSSYFLANPVGRSDWWLYERGYTYPGLVSNGTGPVGNLDFLLGESPIHPVLHCAWGVGDKPKMAGSPRWGANGPNHIIVRDLHSHGSSLRAGRFIAVEGCEWHGPDGGDAELTSCYLATLKDTEFAYGWKTEPVSVTDTGKWNPSPNRGGGFYSSKTTGLMIHGNLAYHGGWADGFTIDGWADEPMPPSQYSHGLYIAHDSNNVTSRYNVLTENASYGAMYRPGVFAHDNAYIDNNIPLNDLGGNYKLRGWVSQYSLHLDNIATSGAYKRTFAKTGAYNWGYRFEGRQISRVGNIICHMANPNDPADIAAKPELNYGVFYPDEPENYYDNTIEYRWGFNNHNIEGKDTAVLDQITIQNYVRDELGLTPATVRTFSLHCIGADIGAIAKDVNRYFKQGFGVYTAPRAASASVTFRPDDRGEGFRWDNRLNRSTNDLPGVEHRDSVDLDGQYVKFGTLTAHVTSLTGATERMDVTSGHLTADTFDGKAEIAICGQLHVGGGNIDAIVHGGRLAISGATSGSIKAYDLCEVLLGPDFAVTDRVEVQGADAWVGWDGTGSPSLTVNGTLAFRAVQMAAFDGIRTADVASPMEAGPKGTGSISGASYEMGLVRQANGKVGALYNVVGTPVVGDGIVYRTEVKTNDGYLYDPDTDTAANPELGTMEDWIVTISEFRGVALPQLRRFKRRGDDPDPTCTPTVTLASGSTVEIMDTSLWPSGTHYLTGTGITVTDNGATLPAGVTVTGGRLVYTKA